VTRITSIFRASISTSGSCVAYDDGQAGGDARLPALGARTVPKPASSCTSAGNPGGTSRELTVAQLAYERDYALPSALTQLAKRAASSRSSRSEAPSSCREANEELFYVENSYKAESGRRPVAGRSDVLRAKVAAENRLRAAVAARPALQAADGSAWTQLAALQAVRGTLAAREAAAGGFSRGLLGDAITLVRAAAERTKPNAQRLPEFTDAALVRVAQRVEAAEPVYPDLEEVNLAFGLSKFRERLGTDDPAGEAVPRQRVAGRARPPAHQRDEAR